MKKFGINFNLVLGSQVISLIGGNVLRFALILFILDFTNSAGTFGLVMAITQLPVFLCSVPGGIIADRLDKKKLIVFFDGVKVIICIGLALILITGTYSVANLTLFIAIFMAILTLFAPILIAATPQIVSEEVLVEANGMIQGVNAMGDLVGFAIGGILVATIGMLNIVILVGILFVISTIIDLFIKIKHVKQHSEFGIAKTAVLDLKDSLNYSTKKNPFIIKMALIMGMFAFLILPIVTVAMPYIVRTQFEASDMMFGFAQAVGVFGMLLGGVFAGTLKKFLTFTNFPKFGLILALISLLLGVIVYAPLFSGIILPFWLFNITIMLMSVVMVLANIIIMSYFQEQVPTKYLGKVLAILMTIMNIATPLGQMVYGQLMNLLGDNMSLLFVMVSILFLGLTVVTRKFFAKGQTREGLNDVPVLSKA